MPAIGQRNNARGHNRLRRYRWQTTAVITAAERGREFAFTVVHDGTGREETAWLYLFAPSTAGTLLTESFEFLWCPLGNRVIELFVPRGSQVNRGIRLTLQRIATAAEAVAPAADVRPINRRRAPDRYASPDSAR